MNILAFNILQTFAKLAKESGFGGFIAVRISFSSCPLSILRDRYGPGQDVEAHCLCSWIVPIAPGFQYGSMP